VVDELRRTLPGFVSGAVIHRRGPESAVAQAFGRYLQTVLERLNQAPDKNKLAFLQSMGIQRTASQPARAIVTFRLSPTSADTHLPAGTRLAAAPPPGASGQVLFESDEATGLAAARISEVVSLWAGRDQYIDHTPEFIAATPFQPFRKSLLQDTPHALYLAHDTLLALAGSSNVDVKFELTTPGSRPLLIFWEYWDGAVWREFANAKPQCLESLEALDGTRGLTRSGTYHLKADCADSKKIAVNDIEAFWIRGRLIEPLPPDPSRTLPEADQILLSTQIARPFAATWSSKAVLGRGRSSVRVRVKAQDVSGAPLAAIPLTLMPAGDTGIVTDATGIAEITPAALGTANQVIASLAEFHGVQNLLSVPANREATQNITFTLTPRGIAPDAAFADANKLDVTKPFYPLGQQAQPGSSFYFSSEEIFSKPTAKFRVYVQTTTTPQEELAASAKDDNQRTQSAARLPHSLAWEYWNGRHWTPLLSYSNDDPDAASPSDFSGTGLLDFEVPTDIERTKVNDQEAFWMRVHLTGGSFGFKQTVTWRDERLGNMPVNQLTFVIQQPPALAAFKLGYTWTHGPYHPEHVFAYNDFRHEDRTEEAKWPGLTFQPYQPVRDLTPALYVGFDKKLPNDRLSIFFDLIEQRGDLDGPALIWEYWDGFTWEELEADDETHDLRVPGLVSFIGPEDGDLLSRFGTPRHWIRARLKEDGPPGEPTLAALFSNALWVTQRQTVTDETLGDSTGQPNQTFRLRQFPVLPARRRGAGEQIEIRELSGPRANVQWRILAAELLGSDPRIVAALEDELGRAAAGADVERGPLRLRSDRLRHVSEAWVIWESRDHLLFSGANDRHFAIERAEGRILFGDGTHGKIPPQGATVRARVYQTGGGTIGNVPSGAIKQVLGGGAGIEAAFNPKPAEGGADTETLAAVRVRGPQSIRHRGRAVTASDFEAMAREASAAVGFARGIPGRNPAGQPEPGWVTLLIIPYSSEPRPQPTFGLREQVRTYVEARAGADIAAAQRIFVCGPDYLLIDVHATVAPIDSTEARAVENAITAALMRFFHPLSGGPDGRGWDLGRDVFLSDVASVIEGTEGVDYVKELALLMEGGIQGETVAIANDRIAIAGNITIKMLQAE
jgi:hypothetical protein